MAYEMLTLGELRCVSVDFTEPEETEGITCVLCHGFGASGDDLVGLAGEILRMSPELQGRVRFLFPEAPIDLTPMGAPGGRAWWPLDLMRLQQGAGIRDLRNERPPLLPTARQLLIGAIEADSVFTGRDWSQTVIGGFSQGAMLAMDVSLNLEESPAGVFVLSGSLLCEEDWREKVAQRAGMRVFQSHGREDMVLPFQGAEWLREFLEGAGIEVEFLPFSGGHTIPRPALTRMTKMLEEHVVQ